jgi:transcriptional regulator with XRE-family HTH domain
MITAVQLDVDEVVDRSVEALANRLGRCPTVDEVAEAAGITAHDVLESLDSARPRMLARTALYLRCVEGLDRAAIAERMGVRRAEVSRLLRANVSQSPRQPPAGRLAPWSPSHSHLEPALPGAARTSSPASSRGSWRSSGFCSSRSRPA